MQYGFNNKRKLQKSLDEPDDLNLPLSDWRSGRVVLSQMRGAWPQQESVLHGVERVHPWNKGAAAHLKHSVSKWEIQGVWVQIRETLQVHDWRPNLSSRVPQNPGRSSVDGGECSEGLHDKKKIIILTHRSYF